VDRILDIIMPETASAPPKARKRYVRRSSLAALAIVLSSGLAVSVSPEALFFGVEALLIVFLVWEFSVLMRALDELQFRIHMTALAIAGGVAATSCTVLSVIALAGEGQLPALAGALALPTMGIGYYIALFVIARRYS